MSFRAWRRVPEAGACDFCLMLATRGAVYKSQETAGEIDSYHRACACGVEMETDFDLRRDIRISPEDANRQIEFRSKGRDYGYDMSEYRNIGVTDPPRVPRQRSVVPRSNRRRPSEAATRSPEVGALEYRRNLELQRDQIRSRLDPTSRSYEWEFKRLKEIEQALAAL